jgi:membrane protease YdiL (CAAX protease family)
VSELAFSSSDLALAGLVLLAGGLSLAPLAAYLSRRIFPGRHVFFARWGFSHVLLLLGIALLASPLAWLVAYALPLGTPTILRELASSAFLLALLGLCVVAWAERLDPAGWLCLGLRGGRHLRALGSGMVVYVLLYPTLLGAGLAWPWLLERLGGEFSLQQVALGLAQLEGPELALGVVLAALVQPLLEELLFRAFLQPLLVQNLGDKLGVVATSLAFALLHGAEAFLPIFALSLLLGAVMLRTQRLLAAWAVHGAHNALMMAGLVLARDSLA